MLRSVVYALSLGALALQPLNAAQEHYAVDCDGLNDCLAKIRDPEKLILHVDSVVHIRMQEFGNEGIEALIALLIDQDKYVRDRAGYILANFETIDPTFSDPIIGAWQSGNGWLPTAVAALRTERAYNLLWEAYLAEEDRRSNDFAVAKIEPERLRPLFLEASSDCLREEDEESCADLVSLLWKLDPAFPDWSHPFLIDLLQNAENEDSRERAREALAKSMHPVGLTHSQRELKSISVHDASNYIWRAMSLIRDVAAYGADAKESAAYIARYLSPELDERLRARATLALGQIGDRSQIPALLALENELMDDWLLAYNASESLGRLRAENALPLLEKLAIQHWHRGVRNNARRAVSMIGGGEFIVPGVVGDGTAYALPPDADGNEYHYFGDLRWAGDEATNWCFPESGETLLLQNDPVGEIEWPADRDLIGEFAEMTGERTSEIREMVPGEVVPGYPMAILPIASGNLLAFNAGEFGGGAVFLKEDASPRRLTNEPVDAVWIMNDDIYILSGITHLIIDEGQVSVIDLQTLEKKRNIRLPASMRRIGVSNDHLFIIETSEGDLAIAEDGTLYDAGSLSECAQG